VATFSTYLGLKLNASTDPFQLSDFISNWSILDASPGIFITTSAARPVYNSSQAGRLIFLTDLHKLEYWSGSAWVADALYAPPVFHGGVDFEQSIGKGQSQTFNCLTFSISRPCSVAIIVTAQYQIGPKTYQELFQQAVFDGNAVSTGFREHTIISSENVSHNAFGSLVSPVAISTVAAGSHTVGVLAQIQAATSSSVTLNGCKAVVIVSNYNVANAF
jgi:hypothetical protein